VISNETSDYLLPKYHTKSSKGVWASNDKSDCRLKIDYDVHTDKVGYALCTHIIDKTGTNPLSSTTALLMLKHLFSLDFD